MGDFRVHHVRFFDYTPSAIHCLAYNSELQKLAVSRSDGSIEIWNLKENWLQEKVLPPPEEKSIEALIWCNQRLFSAGLHGNIHEHDLLTGNVKSSGSSNGGPIWCLSKNKTGTQIAAGTEDGCVVVFDVTDEGIEYSRALDRQEGRILSLAWHHGENVIVSGGTDNLRVWSLKSGHAIQRLSLGRQEHNKETIVWTVAVTDDFTIVSGDSRGKTCFWNGRQGTLVKSYQSHKADVLTLSVHQGPDNEVTVASSGIDPTLTQFKYISTNPSSDVKMWVKSSSRLLHTHDVRAVTFTDDGIVSGGVDCQLIHNSLDSKSDSGLWNHRTIPGIPQGPIAYTAKEANMILLRYANSLELWKLGSTSASSSTSGEFLKLDTRPFKVLQLKSKDNELITCAAVAPSGEWIAYSDRHRLRLFQISIEDNIEVGYPNIAINKVRLMPPGVLQSHCLQFSPDGSTLYSATCEGKIQLIKVDLIQPDLSRTLTPPAKDLTHSTPCCMAVSLSGKHLAVGHLSGQIHVYDLKKHKHKITLPRYPHTATALAFHPQRHLLVVVYSNQKIMEYDFVDGEYTDWSRSHMDKFSKSWENSHHKIRQVMYNPRNLDQIVLRNIKGFHIIDKSKPGLLGDIYKPGHKAKRSAAFHSCTKFMFLLHFDLLDDDYLLAVERTPMSLQDQLPPSLKQTKFGT